MPRITDESGDSDSSETEVKRPQGDDDETEAERPATDNTPLLRNRNRGRDYGATGTSSSGPVAVRPPACNRPPAIARGPIDWPCRRAMFQNP